jgi:hypothetical protein
MHFFAHRRPPVGFIRKLGKELGVSVTGDARTVTSVTEKETLSPVSSLGEAQGRVSFAVREPQGFGPPAMIAASAPGAAGREAVVFRYQDPGLGTLTVLERAGGDEVVTIRGGVQATIATSGTGSMLRWIENGVSYSVIAEQGTREQLLAAAERI